MEVLSNVKQPIPMSEDASTLENVTLSHILSSQPRVVVEDISSSVNAGKLKRLNKPGNPHSLRSHLVADKKYLESLPFNCF